VFSDTLARFLPFDRPLHVAEEPNVWGLFRELLVVGSVDCSGLGSVDQELVVPASLDEDPTMIWVLVQSVTVLAEWFIGFG
jgi:hypothetical protein